MYIYILWSRNNSSFIRPFKLYENYAMKNYFIFIIVVLGMVIMFASCEKVNELSLNEVTISHAKNSTSSLICDKHLAEIGDLHNVFVNEAFDYEQEMLALQMAHLRV